MGAPPSLLVILFLPPLFPGALLATPGHDDLAAALLACVVGGLLLILPLPFIHGCVLCAIWQLPQVADEFIRGSFHNFAFLSSVVQ